MSLSDWKKNGWLRDHTPTKQEIENLFEIVKRDLNDSANATLSNDWRFGISYNAALKLCTILLHSSGYRPEKNLAHYRTLQSLPEILGPSYSDDADYLDLCRKKRNQTEYDFAGTISLEEVEELTDFCQSLRADARKWLKKHYPELI